MDEVEARLMMPSNTRAPSDEGPNYSGFERLPESWMAHDARTCQLALAGSYYPDHVVFLGPALPQTDHDGNPPVMLIPGKGVYLRHGATASQRAMITCLSDCLSRLPSEWQVVAIGADAEAELLNWDAEKYRQALAART
jgi:rhamnose utilization protein RhaD (predicted bifunctional aldolase and dehydrogenase)